jgi:hypothetical protein
MATREVVICSPVRTAIGTYGGTLKATHRARPGQGSRQRYRDRHDDHQFPSQTSGAPDSAPHPNSCLKIRNVGSPYR